MSIPKVNARVVLRMPGVALGPIGLAAGSCSSFSAEVQDFSILGIGLIGDTEYPVGSRFVFEKGPIGWNLPNTLTLILRHATRRPDGRWLLGFSFSRALTADDVETLV
jgi:hypothetical protein